MPTDMTTAQLGRIIPAIAAIWPRHSMRPRSRPRHPTPGRVIARDPADDVGDRAVVELPAQHMRDDTSCRGLAVAAYHGHEEWLAEQRAPAERRQPEVRRPEVMDKTKCQPAPAQRICEDFAQSAQGVATLRRRSSPLVVLVKRGDFMRSCGQPSSMGTSRTQWRGDGKN